MHTGMIDIHCHILPGVDDGSRSMEESIEMLRMAWEQGFTRFIATPHRSPQFRPRSRETLLQKCEELEQEAREQISSELRIDLGQELLCCSENLDALHTDDDVIRMAHSDSILLEFFPEETWYRIQAALREVRSCGYRPVIAHVERYEALKDPDRIRELRSTGVRIQMNYDSLEGGLFDREAARCRKLVSEDLVDFLGTDMHSTRSRAPKTAGAMKWMKKHLSEARIEALTAGNAESTFGLEDE